MEKNPSVDQYLERAQRMEAVRLKAIRDVALTRQRLLDVRADAVRQLADLKRTTDEQIADAEREDLKQYTAALGAGWSAEEMRKIGLPEPEKRTRARRRSARTTPTADTAAGGVHEEVEQDPATPQDDAPVRPQVYEAAS